MSAQVVEPHHKTSAPGVEPAEGTCGRAQGLAHTYTQMPSHNM